jgi:hypothetical protein
LSENKLYNERRARYRRQYAQEQNTSLGVHSSVIRPDAAIFQVPSTE